MIDWKGTEKKTCKPSILTVTGIYMAFSSRYETTGFEVQTRDPLLEGLKAT